MWIHGLPWTSKSGWGVAGLPVAPVVPMLGLARPGVIAGVMEPVDLLAPGISSRPANTGAGTEHCHWGRDFSRHCYVLS